MLNIQKKKCFHELEFLRHRKHLKPKMLIEFFNIPEMYPFIFFLDFFKFFYIFRIKFSIHVAPSDMHFHLLISLIGLAIFKDLSASLWKIP